MKYAVVTFGCRVNQADSLGIESELSAAGGEAVPADRADLVIVNTCSVTASRRPSGRYRVSRTPSPLASTRKWKPWRCMGCLRTVRLIQRHSSVSPWVASTTSVCGQARPLTVSTASRERWLKVVVSKVNHDEMTKTRSPGATLLPGGSTMIAPWRLPVSSAPGTPACSVLAT